MKDKLIDGVAIQDKEYNHSDWVPRIPDPGPGECLYGIRSKLFNPSWFKKLGPSNYLHLIHG
jgi:hypothetical protein